MTRLSVLLVEDECCLQRSVPRVLPEHHIVTVSNGLKALDLLKEDEDFDVILSDVDMPECSGVELYNTLKREKPHLLPRLLLWSGRDQPQLRERGVQVLMKPLPVNQLREKLGVLGGKCLPI